MTAPVRFRHAFRVRLHDTDAAGVMFYGHLFRHAHDAYEAFMAELGFPLEGLIRAARWHLPLVHAAADYAGPMRHGDRLQVELRLEAVGHSAFTLLYRFVGDDGQARAEARTVHVCTDPRGSGSHPLPQALRAALLGDAAPPRGTQAGAQPAKRP